MSPRAEEHRLEHVGGAARIPLNRVQLLPFARVEPNLVEQPRALQDAQVLDDVGTILLWWAGSVARGVVPAMRMSS